MVVSCCTHSMKQYQIDRILGLIDANGPIPELCPERGPCAVWLGRNHPKTGRPQHSVMENGKRTWRNASRALWLTRNPDPGPDLYVCHRCMNQNCVAYDHLYLGTPEQNSKDRDAVGRGMKGKRHESNCKLTPENQVEIRRRVADGEAQVSVAKAFGVDPSHVSRLSRYERGMLDTSVVQKHNQGS